MQYHDPIVDPRGKTHVMLKPHAPQPDRDPVAIGLAGGGGLEGADVAVDFVRDLVFGDFELVVLLHVHPELGAIFEVAAQPQSGIRGDAAALIHDLSNARDRHMKVHRQSVHAEAQGLQEFLAQDFPGMDRL
jgi:hypothetical protein